MSGEVARVLRQGGAYAFGNLLLKISGFVLALWYVAQLPQSEFGHFGLLDATAKVCILFGGLGLNHGLLKYLTDATYKEKHPTLPFTALITTVVVAGFLFVAMWIAAPWLTGFLLDDKSQGTILYLLAGYIVLKIVAAIPLMVLRVTERVGLYIVATVGEVLLLVLGVYYFLVLRDGGLRGVLNAFVLSAGVAAALLVGAMLSRVPWRFDGSWVPKLVAFGAPLVIGVLGSQILNVGDRYLLKAFTDAATVAVYDLAARVSGVFNLVFVQSFQLSFMVIGLKSMSVSKETEGLYRRTFRHFVLGSGWAVLAIALLAVDIIGLITSKSSYLSGQSLVFPYTLGFMAYGINVIMMNSIYAAGRSVLISSLILGSALFNIALNCLLIPVWGPMGAAVATLLAYTALAGTSFLFSRKQFRVAYRWRTLGGVVLLIALLYVSAWPSLEWAPVPRLAFRAGAILAYPFFVVLFGWYTRDELKAGLDTLRKKVGLR